MKTEGEHVDEDEPMVKLEAELRSGSYHGDEPEANTDRLLNDEELIASPFGEMIYNEDGSVDIRASRFNREREVAQTQDAKTLKAVGEWLEENGGYEGGVFSIGKTAIEQLIQGKMPE